MHLWLQDCGNINVFVMTAFSPNFISQLCPAISKLSVQQTGVRACSRRFASKSVRLVCIILLGYGNTHISAEYFDCGKFNRPLCKHTCMFCGSSYYMLSLMRAHIIANILIKVIGPTGAC